MALTVNALKAKLQNIIAPGNDTEFLRLLQEADDRLLEFGRWNWTRTRVTLTPDDESRVSLTSSHISILAARLGSIPQAIHTEEFEFTPDGIGEVPINGCESYAGLIDLGMVTDDFGSGTETRRAYKITGNIPDGDTVTAIVRWAPAVLSLTPGTSETRCPDYAALKLMMLAINFEEENDIGRSRDYVSTALRGLDNKEKSFRAGARPTMTVTPFGPGISRIRRPR